MSEERNDLPENEQDFDADLPEDVESAVEETPEELDLPVDAAPDFDVEQALAAVASLHQLIQDQDEETPDQELAESFADEPSEPEIGEYLRVSGEYDGETLPPSASHHDSAFAHPPVSILTRGQAASVIPALLLIASGALLTFLLTTTDTQISLPLLGGGLAAILGAALLAYWLSSRRWAGGAFFAGSALLLVGGTTAWLVLFDTPGLAEGYPLLLTALGAALVLTDLFAPVGGRIWSAGLMLAVGGLAGTAVTTGLIGEALRQSAAGLLPAIAAAAVILLIAPFFQRRRS